MSPDNPNTFNEEDNAEDGASTPMLNAETYGQQLDDNNASGQEKADEMDDSLRSDTQEMNQTGPAPASDENLPRELTNPSDRAFTLPEEQGPN
ncbi:hypothetical protein [Hymenobacter convexus]|uniref:hypothetical protein n=1 Tax=Hymenobacter sp. CA1UV-4 TaxID=3063782 RepID=UPI002712B282|nr:hypothetical protein [Hymenobacter sp. CA1UV-4]MDO7851453.1 hypothetical protein [Hymenobacter sp. CA1UV-4]